MKGVVSFNTPYCTFTLLLFDIVQDVCGCITGKCPGVSPTPWAGGEFRSKVNLAHQVPATVVLEVLIVSGKT